MSIDMSCANVIAKSDFQLSPFEMSPLGPPEENFEAAKNKVGSLQRPLWTTIALNEVFFWSHAAFWCDTLTLRGKKSWRSLRRTHTHTHTARSSKGKVRI